MAEKSREDCSDPNLHLSDFSLGSLSQPSEPPDIKNWFSSYAYESFVLDTQDEVKDFDTPKTESQQRNVASDEETKILGSSDSLSLPSEPPDIRNWFSSYAYESFVLDTQDEVKDFDTGKSESQEVSLGSDEETQSETEETQSETKDNHFVKVSDESDDRHDLSPLNDDANSCLNDGNSVQKLDSKLFLAEDLTESEDCREVHQDRKDLKNEVGSPPTDCVSSSLNDGNSVQKLESKKVSLAEVLIKRYVKKEKEVDNVLSNGVSEIVNASPPTKPLSYNNMEGEEGKESVADGFISTKKTKNTSGNCRNVLKRTHQENQIEHVAKTDTGLLPNGLHGRVERKPLSERTNAQNEVVVLEIAGKWKCPQKNKPDLGPPLKQLRLERWINRVK